MAKLAAIRERLHRLEEAHRRRESLWSERNLLEAELNDLLETRIGSLLEEDPRLEELKQQKVTIDHLIDEIEEQDEQTLAALREEMIATFLQEHPDERERYHSLNDATTEQADWVQTLSALHSRLQLVVNSIGAAVETWDLPLLTKMARFVFGQSPTEMITQHLERSDERATSALQLLSTFSPSEEDLRLKELKEQFEQILNGYLLEREKRWGFGQLRNVFRPIVNALEELLDRLSVQQELASSTLSEQERQFEEWLHSFE